MKWAKQRLGDVAHINPKPHRILHKDELVSFAGMADLSAERGSIAESILRPYSEARKGYTSFQADDILVAKITPCFENCKIGMASIPTEFGYGSTEFHVIRPLDARLDKRYTLHFLRQKKILLAGERRMTGSAGQRRVPSSFLEELEIPLPPLDEQRRIAAILDKAGEILSSSRQAEALRQKLRTRLFISMFGDPRSNPFAWPRLSIEELTSDYIGGAALAPEDFTDQGTPVLHKGAIKPGGRIEFDTRKKGFVSPQTAQAYRKSLAGPGKVAVTLRDLVPSGPFIGLMAELSTTEIPEFLLAQGAYAFTVDTKKILPSYLVALVNTPTFRLILRQNAVGSTQIHIRLPVFKSIEMPVPPIEMQHEFSRITNRLSTLGALSEAQLSGIQCLSSALQSSSFSWHDP